MYKSGQKTPFFDKIYPQRKGFPHKNGGCCPHAISRMWISYPQLKINAAKKDQMFAKNASFYE
jgi:hypothetical protein